ncbi:MAG: hypothetical protein AAF490_00625 [Chloroflexota bacterium]
MTSFDQWERLLDDAPDVEGVGLMEMIDYPLPMSKLLNQIMKKRRVTAVVLADLMELSLNDLSLLIPHLLTKGYLISNTNALNETEYRVNLLRVRGREQFKDIWPE